MLSISCFSPSIWYDPVNSLAFYAYAEEDNSMATSQFRGEVRAPDFPNGLDWINSDHPLHISEFRNHILIVHFWTLS